MMENRFMTIPAKQILILSIMDGGEGVALRSMAEQIGIHVEWYGIGMARDLFEVLNRQASYDLVVFCCHGKDGRMVMPELEGSLYKDQPFRGDMTPEDVRGLLGLQGQKVFSTGCATGEEKMASAFLDAGCAWYLAPSGYPDGAAALVFAVNFLHLHLNRGFTADDAVNKAQHEREGDHVFTLYGRNHKERS